MAQNQRSLRQDGAWLWLPGCLALAAWLSGCLPGQARPIHCECWLIQARLLWLSGGGTHSSACSHVAVTATLLPVDSSLSRWGLRVARLCWPKIGSWGKACLGNILKPPRKP